MKKQNANLIILILFAIFIFACNYVDPKKDQNELLKTVVIVRRVQATSPLPLSPSTCVYQQTQYYECADNLEKYGPMHFTSTTEICDWFGTDGKKKLTNESCSSLGFTSIMLDSFWPYYDRYRCRFGGNVRPYETACSSQINLIFPKDETAPRVTSTYPTNGITSVSPETEISIYLTEPLDSDSVNTATIKISSDSTQVSNLHIMTFGLASRVDIKPASSLSSQTKYTVTVSKDVKDYTGNTLGTDYSFSFTTQ